MFLKEVWLDNGMKVWWLPKSPLMAANVFFQQDKDSEIFFSFSSRHNPPSPLSFFPFLAS